MLDTYFAWRRTRKEGAGKINKSRAIQHVKHLAPCSCQCHETNTTLNAPRQVAFGSRSAFKDTNFDFPVFWPVQHGGIPGIEEQDKTGVDDRFKVFASVDFPKQERTKGHWYPAIPPLCRPSTGLCPADYFGRTLVSNLPPQIKVGVVNVSVAGCKIELFQKDSFRAYAVTAPPWMTNIIAVYGGNPYEHLVAMAKLAQKDGIVKGILLHQGESNTNDKQWPDKVKGIYDSLLGDLNLKAEEVPLLAGGLVPEDQKGACASMNKIIAWLPKAIPRQFAPRRLRQPPDTHFSAGYRQLGTRYALKMLSILGSAPEASK